MRKLYVAACCRVLAMQKNVLRAAPFLLLWKTKSVNGHNAPIKKNYNATYSAVNCLHNVNKILPQRKTWRKRALLLAHALFREEIKRTGS